MKENSQTKGNSSSELEYNLGNSVAATFFPCLGLFLYGWDYGATAWSLYEIEEIADLHPESWASWIKESNLLEGFFSAGSTLGMVIGVLLGVTILKHLSYISSMRLGTVILMTGSTLQAASGYIFVYNGTALTSLVTGRLIYGVGTGLVCLTAPKYIGEVSPDQIRGTLSSGMELAVVSGICLSYGLGYFSDKMGRGWELIFQLETVPALIMFVGLNVIPESPRRILTAGKSVESALEAAKFITPGITKESIQGLQIQLLSTSNVQSKPYFQEVYEIFTGRLSGLVQVGLVLVLLQQVAGAPCISYYIVTILDDSYSWSTQVLMYHLMVIGGCKIVGDLFATTFIDYFGRKSLLLMGYGMAGLSNLGITLFYKFGYAEESYGPFFMLSLLLLNCEIIGTVVWVLLGELFPMEIKDHAISVCLICNFFLNYGLNMAFANFESELYYPFAFFCVCSFLGMLYVQRKVPRVSSTMAMETMQSEFIAFCCDSGEITTLLPGTVAPLCTDKRKNNAGTSTESDSLLRSG